MRERGATRPFEGRLETWSYPPINDTEMVASAIRRALGLETEPKVADPAAHGLRQIGQRAYLFVLSVLRARTTCMTRPTRATPS